MLICCVFFFSFSSTQLNNKFSVEKKFVKLLFVFGSIFGVDIINNYSMVNTKRIINVKCGGTEWHFGLR